MVNKLTGLVALALLAGGISMAAVGCSSDSENTDEDASTGDGGGRVPREGGASSGSEPTTCEPAAATAADFEDFYWPTKVATAGACTAADVDALIAEFAKTGGTWTDLKNAVSASCQSCLFTDLGDGSQATLGALSEIAWIGIVSSGANAGAGIQNPGFCVGSQSGKPSCGAAYATFVECGSAVCQACGSEDPQTGAEDADREACTDLAYGQGGVCITEAGSLIDAECGIEEAGQYEQKCNVGSTNEAFVRNLLSLTCGPTGNTTPDAGTPDAGDNDPE